MTPKTRGSGGRWSTLTLYSTITCQYVQDYYYAQFYMQIVDIFQNQLFRNWSKFYRLRSAIIYQGDDLPALGAVLDGTKCGNEMVGSM